MQNEPPNTLSSPSSPSYPSHDIRLTEQGSDLYGDYTAINSIARNQPISDEDPVETHTSPNSSTKLNIRQRLVQFFTLRTLSHNGWKIALVLCVISNIATTLSYAMPWWSLDYWGNCDSVHIVIHLDDGVCLIPHSGGFGKSDCIHWDQKSVWQEIDALANTDTEKAATHTYRTVRILFLSALCTGALQIAICIFSMKYNAWTRYGQCMMIGVCIIYQQIVISAQSLGGDNDITALTTWETYYDINCAESASYPYTSYYMFILAQNIVGIVTLVVWLPNLCCCCHLVAFDSGDNVSSIACDLSVDAPRQPQQPIPPESASGVYSSISYDIESPLCDSQLITYSSSHMLQRSSNSINTMEEAVMALPSYIPPVQASTVHSTNRAGEFT